MPSLISRPRLHSSSSQDATRTSRAADDVTLPVALQKTQHLQGGKPAASASADRGLHDGSGAETRAEISTRASPGEHNVKDSSGLFNRLLQRGKSLKRKPRPSSRGISAPNQRPASRPDEGPIAGTSVSVGQQQQQQQQSFSNSPQNLSALQQQSQRDQPRATTPIPVAPALVAESTVPPNAQIANSVPQPRREDISGTSIMAKPIVRKPSLRDRFRLKSSTTPSPEEQRKPSVIYIPKHAATDFSRMVVTSRPRASYSFDEDRTLSPRNDDFGVDAHALTKELEELQIKPNRHSSTLQPLPEAEPDPFAHEVQLQNEPIPKSEYRRGHSRNQSLPSAKPRGHRQRHSQTNAADPGEVPPPPAPVSHPQAHRHNASTASAPSSAIPRHLVDQESEKQAINQVEQHAGLSDYELFLQRAEEEDRAQRERMLHGIPYRVKTQPPLNPFYTTNFAPVSAPVPALDDIHETDHQEQTPSHPSDAPLMIRAGLAAGGGSRSSGTRTRRDSSQYGYQLHSGPMSGGNPNRGSWSASNEAEKEKERKVSGGAIPEYTLPVDANYVGAASGVQYQAREPRGLKRQGSITQRIAEYIKPSRERSKHDSPVAPGAVPRR